MSAKALIIGCSVLLAACAAENSPLYYSSADTAMKQATYEEAVKAYDASIHEKYHTYGYFNALGDIDFKYKMYGNAVNAYTRSLMIKSSGEVQMKRVKAYMALQYYHDAELDLTDIMMNYEGMRPLAYAERAKARIAQGNYKEALEDLNKVLKISGESADVDKGLAEAYLSMNNIQQAMVYAVKAVDADQNDPEKYFIRGKVFYKTKDANQAISDYKKALSIKPDYTEVQYALAWVYATCPAEMYRDGKQSLDMAQKLFDSDKSSSNVILLAAAYAQTGDFDKAVALLKEQADNTKDLVAQDDMRVYAKSYEEKKTLGAW